MTARALHSNLAKVTYGEKIALLPNDNYVAMERKKYVGVCPNPSKQMAMGTETIMTTGTSLGCSEQERGPENVLLWLSFLQRHMGGTGWGKLPDCCQGEQR